MVVIPSSPAIMTTNTTIRNQNIGADKTKITLTMNSGVVERLDKERGDIERSVFIQRIIEKHFKLPMMPYKKVKINPVTGFPYESGSRLPKKLI